MPLTAILPTLLKFDRKIFLLVIIYQSFIDELTHEYIFSEITEQKVFQVLSSMSPNKASGLDKFPVKLVKIAAPYITKSLTAIFNRSISTGIFPCDWKVAKVTPIHKDGDKSDMDNYRPISVISIIAKIMEKLVHSQLYSYLERFNILQPNYAKRSYLKF